MRRHSKRGLEEFIHPFSPIRRRRTPQPPPKVEVNIEGTDNKGLPTIASKKEIPLVGITEVKTKEPDKDKKEYKKKKMDDYETFMYGCNDDDTFKGDGASDECGVRTYSRPKGQRKYSHCDNVNCSGSGCDASVSSLCSVNTYGGPRTMGKIQEFCNDLQRAERIEELASESESQDARVAQLKLNKWNWLLNWLDLSRDRAQKAESRRLLNPEITKKSAAERKAKPQQQQQRNQISIQQESDKNKIGRNSPTGFMKIKPKLAKNEGVDIVGLAEGTKPENTVPGTGRTTIRNVRSCTKRRAALKKPSAKKTSIKKKIPPKLTRKFLADIKKKYAKILYRKN